MPRRFTRAVLSLVTLALGVALSAGAVAAADYSIGVNGFVTWPGPAVVFQSTIGNGPKSMCLPNGGTVCGSLSTTGPNGAYGLVDTRVSLESVPAPTLFGRSHAEASGWAYTNIVGALDGGSAPGYDVMLHIAYSWSQEPGAGFVLNYYATGGLPPPYSFNGYVHSGGLGPSGTGMLDLPIRVAGFFGYTFQITLQLAVNSGADVNLYNQADVSAWVQFWVDIPEGTRLSDGTVNLLLSEAASVPAPGGAPFLMIAAGAIVAWRRTGRPQPRVIPT